MNALDYRAERFMNNLDSWGVTSEVPRPVFDGFSMDTDPLEGIEQEIPEVEFILFLFIISLDALERVRGGGSNLYFQI